ncbi:gem-associated protein 4b-like [Glossina fuscipes fuscipes]
MRDLYRTLEMLRAETPMEYCEEFDGIKSILEYCNNYVKPFSKVHFRGGNVDFKNDLVKRLQSYLIECNLVSKEEKKPLPSVERKLRKIVMFFVLNTDATYKYNLRDDVNVAHVFEICPLLPKFLVVTLIWELNLEPFFYELLSFTPCWFAFQYFEPATDSLKYIDDVYDVLGKVEQLLKAIFINLTRTEIQQINPIDLKIMYKKLYDYATNLLRLFYTPDAEKFQKFTKKQLHKYSGFALKHLLQMIIFAFDVYEQSEEINLHEHWEIYDVGKDFTNKIAKLSETSQSVRVEQLAMILALLNTLQTNVMMITMKDFIYWVEVDLTENITLQAAVGAMAYEVMDHILKNKAFSHDVAQQLKTIAIRPKTLQETIHNATIGDILHALDDLDMLHHIRKAWLDELFNRPIALINDECLEAIKSNIKIISLENCQQMLDFIKLDICRNISEPDDEYKINEKLNIENNDIDGNDYEDLGLLISAALENFSISQVLAILNYQSKLFGFKSTLFMRPDLEQRITEFLNKYNADSNTFDYHHFLVLTFEHPDMVWKKLFDSACHNTLAHIKNYCAAVKQSRPLSNNYYMPHLLAALEDVDYLQKEPFPQLLCELYFELYYPDGKTQFLKQIINKYTNIYLDGQLFANLLPLVKTLNLIGGYGETQSYKPLTFGEMTAPVLLTVAQIMDKSRWDLITYTDIRDEIVRECIQFIQQTSKKFLPNATEKDRKWITKIIKDSYKPLTQYYFQKYALTPEQIPIEFDRFLIRLDIEDKSEAQMFLIINYVRCTMKEAEWLARSERLLPHISNVMLILSGVVEETQNSNAINNYRHCLINYANIVQKFLLPKIEDNVKQIEKLQLKVLKIISATPEQIYEETFINFEPLLMEITEKLACPLEENSLKIIRNFVQRMKDCNAKDIFLKKFEALDIEMK